MQSFGKAVKYLSGLMLSFLLFGSACSILTPGPAVDYDFYYDRFDIELLIRDEDAPRRKASLRQLAQALRQEEAMVSPAGKKGDFIAEIEQCLRLDPYNPYVYYFLSRAQLQENRFANAEAAAKKSRQLLGPEPIWQAKALVLEARANVGLNRKGKAEELYGQAEKLDPDNPLIPEGRAQL